MEFTRVLAERRSVRGFQKDPLPEAQLSRLFERAQRAPSWCNIQPWRVWVTSGETTARLTAALSEAAKGMPNPDIPWPGDYPAPYADHRRGCGVALYQAMGIERGDKAARYGAWMRNYAAFDAPHVAIVGFDRRIGEYAALDVGCWLQSFLLAAWDEGVATCPMASLAAYPGPSREMFDVPEEIVIAFGVAFGLEDPAVPANACRTERSPIEDNVTFL